MLTQSDKTKGCTSFEEKILDMSDDMIVHKMPKYLRETGLFKEYEIQHIIIWLQDYRGLHHLDVIE